MGQTWYKEMGMVFAKVICQIMMEVFRLGFTRL